MFTVQVLKDALRAMNIKGYSQLKKKELIELYKKHTHNFLITSMFIIDPEEFYHTCTHHDLASFFRDPTIQYATSDSNDLSAFNQIYYEQHDCSSIDISGAGKSRDLFAFIKYFGTRRSFTTR